MRHVLTPADIDEFRDRLCLAATELFAELGEEGLNMRQLAGRLGVSAMTAYRYFSDKEEILAAVRARAFARLADRLQAAHDVTGSLEQTLAVLGRACVDFAREEPALYRLMFDLAPSRTAVAPELHREESRAREALTTPLRALADAGFCSGDPEVIGQMMWSSLHGIIALNMVGQLSDARGDRMIAETLRVLLASCSTVVEFPPSKTGHTDERPSFRSNGAQPH